MDKWQNGIEFGKQRNESINKKKVSFSKKIYKLCKE